MAERKYLDCRLMPSQNNCDMYMSGTEKHLLEAGIMHAVTAHGHKDTPELRTQLKSMMKSEK